jgi:phospholipid/cholesterol/gamma-HCH transport system substrate-binding protein
LNTEAKVGMFVSACVLILGTTIYFVGNEQFGTHLTPYKTYLRYAGGVAPGSEVLFGGIAVGKVTAVRAWKDDPTRIEILLEVKNGTPLNQMSVARLGAVGLMSPPAISITTGANEAVRLTAGQVIPSLETVSIDDMARKLSGIADSAGDLIGQVKGEMQGISGKAEVLLGNLNEATGAENRKQIAGILKEVNTLVARESPKIARISEQVLLMSQDADVIVKDADAAIKKVGPVVDHADGAVASAKVTIDQLREPVRRDIEQLQAALNQASTLLESVQAVVQGNNDNLRETMENLRIATENVDQLTDQVKQRPWSLIRITPPKDRKVPK